MANEIGESPLEGRIVQIKRADMLIANVGLAAGAQAGDQFLVFALGEEIFDPETGVSLGRLEQVKGIFVVGHAQDKLSQLTRIEDDVKTTAVAPVLSAVMAQTHTSGPRQQRIQIGDRVRLLTKASALEAE